MKLRNISKLALCTAVLLSTGANLFAAEDKVDISGSVQASWDHTRGSGNQANIKHGGYGGRLQAASKKSVSKDLNGSGVISLQAGNGGTVNTREAYIRLGSDKGDFTAGRFLVAPFSDLVNSKHEGFFLAQHSGIAYAGVYEVDSIESTENNHLALHCNHMDNLKMELAAHLDTTAGNGTTTPNTQDIAVRPHLQYSMDNLKLTAVVEYITRKDNDASTAATRDYYKHNTVGFGLGGDFNLGELSLGLSLANKSVSGKDINNTDLSKEKNMTIVGRAAYKVNDDWKVGAVVASVTGDVGNKATEDKQTAYLLEADHSLAEATMLRMGYSASTGDTKTGTVTKTLTAQQIKAQLVYNF